METPQVIERRELGCPKTQADTEEEVSDKGRCSELSTGRRKWGSFSAQDSEASRMNELRKT